MIYFTGAGPGAVDLITVRGKELIARADLIIYAGSLVNTGLLAFAKPGCRILDSASLTLEEVVAECAAAEQKQWLTVRLHTGDPSLYGAIREQMDALDALSLPYDVVPGVSSFCAAAAALRAEYTLPGISQSLIITRAQGRTEVPPRESIASFAAHGASMAIFLSAALIDELAQNLIEGGYDKQTPAAIVYRASWPDEKLIRGDVAALPRMRDEHGIRKTALVLVGDFLVTETSKKTPYQRSKLYDPSFSHEYRKGIL